MATHPKLPPTPAPAKGRWRDLLRLLLGLMLLPILAGSLLWAWMGSAGSLATGLRWAQAWLPASQTLQAQGVEGSLRQGGHIEHLVWQREGLTVTLEHFQFQLDLGRLLQGQLPLPQWQVARLHGEDHRASDTAAPLGPWHWPLQVDTHGRIDALHWQAGTHVQAQDLQGHYIFDGQHHRLQLDQLQWAQGRYQGHLQLQADGAQMLTLSLQGQITPPAPSASGPHLPPLQAQLQLQGPLADAQTPLRWQAHLGSADNASGHGPQLDVQGQWQPQATPSLVAVQARLRQLDLALLWPSAPHTEIDGELHTSPLGPNWALHVDLNNRQSGPLDRQRLPVQQMQATLRHNGQDWQVQQALLRWPGGQAQGQGHWQGGTWQGQWQVHGLQAGQWWSSLQGPALSGPISARQNAQGAWALQAQLQADTVTAAAGPRDRLTLQLNQQAQQWQLEQLQLQWANLQLQAQGQWHAHTQQAKGRAQWQAPGMQGSLEGQASPHQGQGQWQLDVKDMPRLQTWLQGLQLPAQHLSTWPGLATLQAQGMWQGGWQGEGLAWRAGAQWPQARLQASGRLQRSSHPNDWQGQLAQLDCETGKVPGLPGPLRLTLEQPLTWRWQVQAQRLQWDSHRWQLREGQDTALLALQAGQWQSAQRGTAAATALPIQARLQARLSSLPLRWSRALGWPELAGNLLLQGGLDLNWGEQRRMLAWLERSTGDLQVSTDSTREARVQAGVRSARAQLRVEGEQAELQWLWDSEQAGQFDAQLHSRLNLSAEGFDALWGPQAPLSGQLQARLPRVGVWAWLAPPGWRVQGALDAQVQVAGTRAQPQWHGQLQADDLAVRSAVEGIEFHHGRLRARLQAQQLLLDEFELQGAGAQGGSVSAQGLVRWQTQATRLAEAVSMDLQMQARGLRVTNRADRRLSVSGQVRAQLQQGRMQLRGELQADSAQFRLTDDNTPTLGRDVVVRGTPPVAPALQAPAGLSVMGMPDIQVLLRLGPDFRLSGQGIDTRLAGEVQLSSNEASTGQPRLIGQVRTEGGRYRAYGQQLDIEQGLLHFNGAYDNPALDIVALRPNLGQRVGVRVSGTALAPRVRLYADPDMPDADKLAWLVLGRSPAAGGAESAVLQQAALALLGGNGKRLGGDLAMALGVDDISLANRSSTTASGTTATGTALMLGKRLSRDFYLAYESSLSGAFGNLFVFYELSRKLTLRAQTGEFNALDLVYTIRHD